MLLRKILIIMVVMIMGSFNPLQDGDWQGLNIMLEKLFFTPNAEARSRTVVKKTGQVTKGKTVSIGEVTETEKFNVVGIDSGSGIEIFSQGTDEENITVPEEGVIYKTQAKIAVPSSYFLDL